MPFVSIYQRDQTESKGPDVSRSIPWHADQNLRASPKRSAYAMAFFGKLGVYLRARAQITEFHS